MTVGDTYCSQPPHKDCGGLSPPAARSNSRDVPLNLRVEGQTQSHAEACVLLRLPQARPGGTDLKPQQVGRARAHSVWLIS